MQRVVQGVAAGSAPLWRTRLRRELIYIALAKAAALTLLWMLFFRSG